MYEKAIVTFIDILGFRDLVSQSKPAEIKRNLDAVRYFATPNTGAEDKHDEFEPKVIQFSDSVIRVRPVETGANSKYQIGILFHELLALVHAQAELIRKGILLRGGIAYGDVYIEGNTVFGPAFVDAYELESKFANYPRIVIAPDLISQAKTNAMLRSAQHDTEEELGYIKKLVTKGDDGIWYVDYCRAVRSELDDPEYYPLFLKSQKDLILKNLKRYTGFTSITSKYLWLANYHNVCTLGRPKKEFKNCDLKRTDVIIGAQEIAALADL